MTLIEAEEGQHLSIVSTGSDDVTCQALRFGIEPGSVISLSKKIPGGPVIIAKNDLEIALGREIALSIQVVIKDARE